MFRSLITHQTHHCVLAVPVAPAGAVLATGECALVAQTPMVIRSVIRLIPVRTTRTMILTAMASAQLAVEPTAPNYAMDPTAWCTTLAKVRASATLLRA